MNKTILEKAYRLEVRKHKDSGRYIASSQDLSGFLAQGKDLQELSERMPKLAKRLLTYRGEEVISCSIHFNKDKTPKFLIVKIYKKA